MGNRCCPATVTGTTPVFPLTHTSGKEGGRMNRSQDISVMGELEPRVEVLVVLTVKTIRTPKNFREKNEQLE